MTKKKKKKKKKKDKRKNPVAKFIRQVTRVAVILIKKNDYTRTKKHKKKVG